MSTASSDMNIPMAPLLRYYKALCNCGATCYVQNPQRVGGICAECEQKAVVRCFLPKVVQPK